MLLLPTRDCCQMKLDQASWYAAASGQTGVLTAASRSCLPRGPCRSTLRSQRDPGNHFTFGRSGGERRQRGSVPSNRAQLLSASLIVSPQATPSAIPLCIWLSSCYAIAFPTKSAGHIVSEWVHCRLCTESSFDSTLNVAGQRPGCPCTLVAHTLLLPLPAY